MHLRKTLLPYLSILVRNLFSPIIIVILVLSGFLFLIHERTDAFFVGGTALLNGVIGLFQELRAKFALSRLEILTAATAHLVKPDKSIKEVLVTSLVPDQIIEIRFGEQVPVDGSIQAETSVMVDEALLTGESNPVAKNAGDTVFAGSLVTAGTAVIKVSAVGSQTRAQKMTRKLKWYDTRLTPIQRQLVLIIRWLSYLAIGLSLVIIWQGLSSSHPLTFTVKRVVAGAIPLVPEGLILASTLLFAYGAVRLAQSGVLVQRVPSIEGFGRLNYLCLDKTGTLTEAIPELEQIIPLNKTPLEEIEKAFVQIAAVEPAPTPSLKAVIPHIPHHELLAPTDFIPFSSERKWSAVSFEDHGESHYFSLGAPDILDQTSPLGKEILTQIEEHTQNGLRVLVLIRHPKSAPNLTAAIELPGIPFALILLSSKLRPNIADTIFYLQAHDVKIKIISGDHPATVQEIARKVGVLHADKLITGEKLALIPAKRWPEIISKTAIFARILPEQKERIVAVLRKSGFTGMVGDGVNDALALKKSDLGVAMFSGSAAARQVSDIVLLNNNFAVFPEGFRLASQIILALEMVTTLFFNRIIFGFGIILYAIIFNTNTILTARHLVAIQFFSITIPALIWSLFPVESATRRDSKQFFKRILEFSVPNGLLTALAIILAYLLVQLKEPQTAFTAAVITALGLGMLSFWLIPQALQATDSLNLRRWQGLYIGGTFVLLFWFLQQPKFNQFFDLIPLSWNALAAILLVIVGIGWAQIRLGLRLSQVKNPTLKAQ